MKEFVFSTFCFLKKYRGVLISRRFALVSFCAILSLVFFAGFYYGYIALNSLPLFVYVIWLAVTIMAFLIAFGKSPSEKRVIKQMENALNDLRHTDVENLIREVDGFLFILPSAKVCIERLRVAFLEKRGELLQAYRRLEVLRKYSLLPKEIVDIELDF